ncbi:uncharacterized protein LOC144099168 isoform X1 [Amblyomma americanum]
MSASNAASKSSGGLFWDVKYALIEPADYSFEQPAPRSSERWSPSQVSSTRPEAVHPAGPLIKIKTVNVYNIVVQDGEVDKVVNILEKKNQRDYDDIDRRRARSPTKRAEDNGRYSNKRQDDREKYQRLQRRHSRRSEYSIRDSGYAHRSRRRSCQDP